MADERDHLTEAARALAPDLLGTCLISRAPDSLPPGIAVVAAYGSGGQEGQKAHPVLKYVSDFLYCL